MNAEARPISISPELHATATGEPLGDAANPRHQEALSLLEHGIERVLNESGYQQYLDFMAKFHRYSWANSLLIMGQKPDATLVNSFDRWKGLGRSVNKGERGLKVFFPYKQLREVTDEETGAVEKNLVVTGFGIGNVWDVSQTNGKPVPETPVLPFSEYRDENGVATEVNKRLSTFLIGREVRCESGKLEGNAMGVFRAGPPLEIVVRTPETTPPITVQTTRTLVHEAGHFLTDELRRYSDDEAEVIAESATYVAMSHYGMPTDDYSFSYVAAYAKDVGLLRKHLGAIQSVSNKLISAVDGEKPEEAEEWL